MEIQREKATYNSINLTAQFLNFADKFLVCGDEQRIQQILLNLQSNALKFTPAHGSVSIIVSLLENASFLQIQVVDTGVGIKKEDQKKLFKLFGFLTSTQDVNAKGIGLGLYICKKLANKLGGDVTLESEVDKGASFSLTLPVDEVPDEYQRQARRCLNHR